MQLTLDVAVCEANGVCTKILPELLALDEDERLHLKVAEVPPKLEEKALRAVRYCPRQALALVEDGLRPNKTA